MHPPFTSNDGLAAVGSRLLDRTLPKSEWTHRAHFASAFWLLGCCPGIDTFRAMPGIIRAYNASTGVANTETSGYHETITMASLRAVHAHLAEDPARMVYAACNALLASPLGRSDWLLAHWSKPRLFSAEARRVWTDPDQHPLPF